MSHLSYNFSTQETKEIQSLRPSWTAQFEDSLGHMCYVSKPTSTAWYRHKNTDVWAMEQNGQSWNEDSYSHLILNNTENWVEKKVRRVDTDEHSEIMSSGHGYTHRTDEFMAVMAVCQTVRNSAIHHFCTDGEEANKAWHPMKIYWQVICHCRGKALFLGMWPVAVYACLCRYC